MKKILFLVLSLVAAVTQLQALTVGESQPVSRIGNLTVTAATTTVIFFRPDGSGTTPDTATASTLVPKGVFIEKIIYSAVSNTAALTCSFIHTDVTYTAGTNEKVIRRLILDSGVSGAETNLCNPREIDFTMNGTRAGIYCKNWPAIKIDSGTNTPVAMILWRKAPLNTTLP